MEQYQITNLSSDNFLIPQTLMESDRKELSLSAVVLYSVLADIAITQTNSLKIEKVDELSIRHFLSFSKQKYRKAKAQLKRANLLVEIISKRDVTFQLRGIEGCV